MAELSEALLSVLPAIRVPKAGDRVHKDECAFSFDTPVSAAGRGRGRGRWPRGEGRVGQGQAGGSVWLPAPQAAPPRSLPDARGSRGGGGARPC